MSSLDVRLRRWTLRATTPYGRRGGVANDFRGALGRAMHGRPEFDRLFRPALVPGREPFGLSGGEGAPLPFVARGPTPDRIAPGEGAWVELLLFGRPGRRARPWDRAVLQAAEAGFGRPRGSFEVTGIEDVFSGTIGAWLELRRIELGVGDASEVLVRVRFETPTWLKSRGERILPTPGPVTTAVLRRSRQLGGIYGDKTTGRADELLDLAAALEEHPLYADEFEEVRTARFSSRQGRRIPLTGIVGWFQGVVPSPLLDCFLAGELLHVGRNTGLGMGQIGVRLAGARV